MGKAIPVYCSHAWNEHGPGTYRCGICKVIWYKFKGGIAPERIIGYTKPEDTP